MDITIPAVLGTILPFVVDLIKRIFPNFTELGLKVLVIILSLAIAILLFISQNGFTWELLIANFFVILASSQVIYGMLLKGSKLQSTITGQENG